MGVSYFNCGNCGEVTHDHMDSTKPCRKCEKSTCYYCENQLKDQLCEECISSCRLCGDDVTRECGTKCLRCYGKFCEMCSSTICYDEPEKLFQNNEELPLDLRKSTTSMPNKQQLSLVPKDKYDTFLKALPIWFEKDVIYSFTSEKGINDGKIDVEITKEDNEDEDYFYTSDDEYDEYNDDDLDKWCTKVRKCISCIPIEKCVIDEEMPGFKLECKCDLNGKLVCTHHSNQKNIIAKIDVKVIV